MLEFQEVLFWRFPSTLHCIFGPHQEIERDCSTVYILKDFAKLTAKYGSFKHLMIDRLESCLPDPLIKQFKLVLTLYAKLP